MAGVDTVAAFLDELYDMEAVFGLYNLRHFLGVAEVKSHGSIFGHELTTAHKADLTATHTLGSLRVKNGKSRELALAAVDTVGIIAQTGFYVVDFLTRDNPD